MKWKKHSFPAVSMSRKSVFCLELIFSRFLVLCTFTGPVTERHFQRLIPVLLTHSTSALIVSCQLTWKSSYIPGPSVFVSVVLKLLNVHSSFTHWVCIPPQCHLFLLLKPCCTAQGLGFLGAAVCPLNHAPVVIANSALLTYMVEAVFADAAALYQLNNGKTAGSSSSICS